MDLRSVFLAFSAVFLFSAFVHGSNLHHPHGPLNGTYGELAHHAVIPSYKQAMTDLDSWNDKINPGEKIVEKTRDACGSTRNLLDVFVYAADGEVSRDGREKPRMGFSHC